MKACSGHLSDVEYGSVMMLEAAQLQVQHVCVCKIVRQFDPLAEWSVHG